MTAALHGPHRGIVDQLEGLLDDLCGRDGADWSGPRVALLSGPSGSGKSRIVRELYERLRTRGGEGAVDPYWPPFDDDERTYGPGLDPMATRKRISPQLDRGWQWPVGALPTFGWWGLNCEQLSSGTPQELLSSLEAQWTLHAVPLKLAHRGCQGVPEKLRGAFGSVFRSVRAALVDEGKDFAQGLAQEALSLVFPGASALTDLALGQVAELRRRMQEKSALEQHLDRSAMLAERDRSAAEELADLVGSLAHPNLPTVVVVEDMHLMGPGLAEFVARLAGSPGRAAAAPVLVIGLVWPEKLHSGAFAHWFGQARADGLVREPIEVPKLPLEDLAQIVLDHAGATSAAAARRIAESFDGNPLFLKLWLTQEDVAEHIGADPVSGSIDLSDDDSVVLPRDIRDVVRGRWQALPEDTREALLHAMVANPLWQGDAPRDPDLDVTAPFPRGIISKVFSEVRGIPAPVADTALRAAVDPARWCVADPDGRQMFTERALAECAHEEAEARRGRQFGGGAWSRLVRDNVTAALQQWLLEHREGTFELREPVLASVVARWYVALTDGDGAGDPTARGLAFRRLAEDAAARRDTTETVLLGKGAVSSFRTAGLPERKLWLLRSWLVARAGWGGEHALAVDLAERLLADTLEACPPKDPAVLSARFDLAWWQGHLEGSDLGAAVAEMEAVGRDATTGGDEESGEFYLQMASDFRQSSGHAHAEADRLEVRLAELLRRHGDDHPDTIAAREEFVDAAINGSGNHGEGIEQLWPLLESQRRLLGSAHPDTQHSLALVLEHGLGFREFDRKLAVASELLAGRRAAYGPDHPLTRRARDEVELAAASLELTRLLPELDDEDWQQGLWHQLDDLDHDELADLGMLERVLLLRDRAVEE